ncbi:MAG: OmpA family protein [Gemmatimonadaceae bacterium]
MQLLAPSTYARVSTEGESFPPLVPYPIPPEPPIAKSAALRRRFDDSWFAPMRHQRPEYHLMTRRLIGLLIAAAFAAVPSVALSQASAVWENYDFVPGSKVLFYTDFSEDRVGNFARGLRFVDGPIEVVDRGGTKVLRSVGRSQFLIPVRGKLPERFTLEIDVIPSATSEADLVVFEGGRELERGAESANVTWNRKGAFVLGGRADYDRAINVSMPEAMEDAVIGKVTHLRVLMDGAYFKMYVNERRIYNIPELAFRRDSTIWMMVTGEEGENAVYITRIRVAESNVDVLYDALAGKGRWATQGILFATGKADVQPESRPVLKEIANTLKEHADLKILIEGHTDNVGASAANLALSEARAAAVKTVLVSQFGVDGSRVTTKGFGDTKPAVPNTTAEGRAQNRRVELVKQ